MEIVIKQEFESEEKAKEWMILNQFGRRNLSAFQRSVLALELEGLFKKKAKEKQKGGQGGVLLKQKSAEAKPIETRKEVAKVAAVSHDTIAKVKKIQEKAPEEVKKKLVTGEISINQAYKDIRKEEIKEKREMKPDKTIRDNLLFFNADCMEIMAQYPDNYFDLAIVDPPYGIGLKFSTREQKDWNNKIPNLEYFSELKRVSRDQIIWGINYYPKLDYDIGGRIVWYKQPSMNNKMKISDCDLALYSKHKRIAYYHYQYYGNVENGSIDWSGHNRIHPTQKPVALYRWLYENYSEKGQKILDTHLGSGSNAIAAHYFGVSEFVGCELDQDYFNDAMKRIEHETRQIDIFQAIEENKDNGEQLSIL